MEHISQIPSTISSRLYAIKISDNKNETKTEEREGGGGGDKVFYKIKKSPKGYRPTWYLKHAICGSSLVSNY